MNQSLLITRPNYDPTTIYLYYWSKSVIDLAKIKGFQIVDLSGDKANKQDFLGRLRKAKPAFLFFNGHGSETTILGQNEEVLISVNDKMDIKNNTIIYSRSCSSAKILGSSCVSNGVKSFIGYTEPFIFAFSRNSITRVLEDKTAALFLEPSNKVATTLIKGHSASEANNRSKITFKRNIKKLLTSETSKENTSTIRFLLWDMKYQVCLGDQNAVLK